jgi:2-dehydro-3-deoxygluconokinase
MFGAKARYVTALPDNSITHSFMAQLRGLGVDVDRILLKKSGRMGVYFVETGANQRGSNVVYDRAHSCISETMPEEYDFENMLDRAKWLHISGITPALSKNAFLSTLEITKRAAAQNIRISCDLNYRKKLWDWKPSVAKTDLARECMEQIVPLSDVIIGNEEDASDVFGIQATGSDVESGKIDLNGYQEVATKMAEKFPNAQYVAITLRESVSADHNNWGAMLYDVKAQQAYFAPLNVNGNYEPFQIRDIVDRVGGGDSFAGGLIYALNSRKYKTPEQAIQFAVAASCLKHSIKGDYNYVSLAEVESLMQGNTSGRVRR